MNDLALLVELLASPTVLVDEVGLPFPRVATDDEPRDGDEPAVAVPA